LSHIAPQVPTTYVGAARNIAIDFTDELDTGELLTGTPTIVEIHPANSPLDLTISNVAVSTADLEINGQTVTTGMAVQGHVSGMLSGVTYKCLVTATTDATPAQTLKLVIEFSTETTVT